MEEKRSKVIVLKRKIDHWIRRTGFDENFINAVKFHLEIIYSYSEKSDIKSEYDYCKRLMSRFFIDKIDMYPTRRFKSQVNEYSDWPLSLLPSEVFGDIQLTADYRKHAFYKCLQVGDLLDCRVASVLPTEYRLRVIHKCGATRILDDINILVVMQRNNSEVLKLKNELFLCELIRVQVLQINSENDTNIYVTVNNAAEEVEKHKKLGRIGEEDLPAYVLDPLEHSSTYSEYLKCSREFKNPILLNNIIEGFGIDIRGEYTFNPTCKSLKPVDVNLPKKDMKLNNIKYYSGLAQEKLQDGNVQEAFDYIEKAIQLYFTKSRTETERTELCKLYEIRGEIHIKMENPYLRETAYLDWELVRGIDPTNECALQHMLYSMYMACNKSYKERDFKTAIEFVERACELDKTAITASYLLKYFKSRYPDAFENLEDASLLDLKKKKKELVSQLKKISRKDVRRKS